MKYPVRFRYTGAAQVRSVCVAGTFNCWVGGMLPLRRTGDDWALDLPVAPGRHLYKFVIDGEQWIPDPANPWIAEDGQNNSSLTVLEDGQVFYRDANLTPNATHTRAARPSPAWLGNGVVYQLSAQAFGGDFDGVRARLPYLSELGVDVLWLMPVQPYAAQPGDPYATSDFLAIEPSLGDAASLRALVDAAHASGMRVILDWTLNRAGIDNALCIKHPEWFTHDEQGRINYLVPNRSYFAGFDFSSRPLRAWLIAAMHWWIDGFGFDGLRFDDSDITPLDYLDEIRTALGPDIALISQSYDELHHLRACDLTYEGGTRDLIRDIASGSKDASDFAHYWHASRLSFPQGALRMRWIEDKEQDRAYRHFGRALHMAAATILLTLDGVPHILMGQECNEPGWNTWSVLFKGFALDWQAADEECRAHYRALLALRRSHPQLRQGDLEFQAGPAIDYQRGELRVVVNLSAPALALPPGYTLLYAQGQAPDGTLPQFASALLKRA